MLIVLYFMASGWGASTKHIEATVHKIISFKIKDGVSQTMSSARQDKIVGLPDIL